MMIGSNFQEEEGGTREHRAEDRSQISQKLLEVALLPLMVRLILCLPLFRKLHFKNEIQERKSCRNLNPSKLI
jgi:hypothetical protein